MEKKVEVGETNEKQCIFKLQGICRQLSLELAEEITSIMGKPLGRATVNKFSDGEVSVNLWESVRGIDCYIVQSTCGPVNDNLMELLIMIDAMKRASAGRINAVIPYYGYARQDSKPRPEIRSRQSWLQTF